MTREILYKDVIQNLVKEIPELRPMLQQHLHDQFGEILPHIFLGDLTRYLRTQVNASGGADISGDKQNIVRKILNFLEKVLQTGDATSQELVGVSFLEYLDPSDPEDICLISVLPPALKHAL